MSKSKGNELLQELYFKLKGLWEKGKPFPEEDRKRLVKAIIREWEEE